MNQPRIALLQENDSPLHDMLAQALVGAQVLVLDPGAEPALPEDAFCGGRLLLWNLSQSTEPTRQAWKDLACREEVGLVLATETIDQDMECLALQCGALAVIGPEHGVGLTAFVLSMAEARQERICQGLAERDQLRQQLADRDLIEKAKSILIVALDLSEPQAMSRLQQQARRTNQKLVEVARKVIATNRVFNGEEG